MLQISKERYLELLDAESELALLEAGGVDNWEWYWESRYGTLLCRHCEDLDSCQKRNFDFVDELEPNSIV